MTGCAVVDLRREHTGALSEVAYLPRACVGALGGGGCMATVAGTRGDPPSGSGCMRGSLTATAEPARGYGRAAPVVAVATRDARKPVGSGMGSLAGFYFICFF